MKKKKINKTNVILSILLVLSASVFIYSLLNIRNWKKDNDETEKEVESIYKTVSVEEVTEGENVNAESQKKESIYWSYIKMNMINVDFTELLKQNSDTKGWIQVNGTNINYPFVQSNDNAYYLNHSFTKKKNEAGWVFLDYRNDINNLSRNNIIYAHSRLDKTMFGSLKNILSNNWYKNTDSNKISLYISILDKYFYNHIIKLSTEKENTLWQVFSVYHIKTENYYITTDFRDDDEFKTFINTISKRSKLKFDASVDVNDTILTLSTCRAGDEKVVLHAKLIKKEVRN